MTTAPSGLRRSSQSADEIGGVDERGAGTRKLCEQRLAQIDDGNAVEPAFLVEIIVEEHVVDGDGAVRA